MAPSNFPHDICGSKGIPWTFLLRWSLNLCKKAIDTGISQDSRSGLELPGLRRWQGHVSIFLLPCPSPTKLFLQAGRELACGLEGDRPPLMMSIGRHRVQTPAIHPAAQLWQLDPARVSKMGAGPQFQQKGKQSKYKRTALGSLNLSFCSCPDLRASLYFTGTL